MLQVKENPVELAIIAYGDAQVGQMLHKVEQKYQELPTVARVSIAIVAFIMPHVWKWLNEHFGNVHDTVQRKVNAFLPQAK